MELCKETGKYYNKRKSLYYDPETKEAYTKIEHSFIHWYKIAKVSDTKLLLNSTYTQYATAQHIKQIRIFLRTLFPDFEVTYIKQLQNLKEHNNETT